MLHLLPLTVSLFFCPHPLLTRLFISAGDDHRQGQRPACPSLFDIRHHQIQREYARAICECVVCLFFDPSLLKILPDQDVTQNKHRCLPTASFSLHAVKKALPRQSG